MSLHSGVAALQKVPRVAMSDHIEHLAVSNTLAPCNSEW
jgi:hypothetical protein